MFDKFEGYEFVDCSIFTGDILSTDLGRVKQYINRWVKAIEEYEKNNIKSESDLLDEYNKLPEKEQNIILKDSLYIMEQNNSRSSNFCIAKATSEFLSFQMEVE